MARTLEERRRALACRRDAWRAAYREGRKQQRYWRDNKHRLKAECKAARKAGQVSEEPGPPANGFSLLPWLLMGMGAFSNLFQGQTPNPWIGGLGVLTFNSLYIYVAFRSFAKDCRDTLSTRLALAGLGVVACALALGYGGNWLLFLPLFGLATGAVLRGRHLRSLGTAVAVLAGVIACVHDGWNGLTIAYATWISTMVTAAILSLSEAVRDLRAAREELARRAVEEERLRFSRDLHDLLGHTLSVIVVKSEAARRLAPRDMDAALSQVADIEAVGRQALTEIREAVTGYREGSLVTELDRARSALTAAGVEPSVSRSGPPPEPQTAALLGWVVREAVTNVVRHSGATRCRITVSGTPERVRLTVTDNGTGAPAADDCRPPGTGLTGLRERLTTAGGALTAGPEPHGGFTVTAELPAELPVEPPAELPMGSHAGGRGDGCPPTSAPSPAPAPAPAPADTAPSMAVGPTLGP
ncbi:sensor histidine kinase [Streptomyces sp. NBC_01485]|uniref:sensor histidine kinase n=1 Tax=Streptomyces sp. NBC_01485 TaxID=2903884 RepID=UPI002E2FB07A|nr:sensor histidine kinase [Streptomyces sp. NBC_01485]